MARKKGPFDAVQFTLESAERIANVVRQSETEAPPASPLRFGKVLQQSVPKQVRAATFSGPWPIGSTKVVTFSYAPIATANVANLSWPITDAGYLNERCIVGKEGTNWWLVVPVLERRTAVFVTQTQQQTFCSHTESQAVVTGVAASFDPESCDILLTTSTATVTIVSATATSVFIAATATSSFLRLRLPG
jgi:hypothetical protein